MIRVLDENTINQIAAGEVIEGPNAVVKELVENSMDAGATAITVEVKNGGKTFIRITDNGSGITPEEIPIAFLSHATSKIQNAQDLLQVTSFGFRGEALASVASVAKVELLSKTHDQISGTRYVIEGGTEITREEVGCPAGTTILVKDLFYNTPARLKFLKSDQTENNKIGESMVSLAFSNPGIRFQLIEDGKTKLQTSGNGKLMDLLYQQYGKEVTSSLIPLDVTSFDLRMHGFIGKPNLNRGTRSFMNYYVNGRRIKNDVITKAIEEGYLGYAMVGRFPFVSLFLEIPPALYDVNVHPAKLEIRFMNEEDLSHFITESIHETLKNHDLVPKVSMEGEPSKMTSPYQSLKTIPKEEVQKAQPFETRYLSQERPLDPVVKEGAHELLDPIPGSAGPAGSAGIPPFGMSETGVYHRIQMDQVVTSDPRASIPSENKGRGTDKKETYIQQKMEISEKERIQFRIIGQVFGTYWLIEYNNELLMIDQHAAHEKVLFEKFMKEISEKKVFRQNLMTPILLTLTNREKEVLEKYRTHFMDIGFEIEPFGGNDWRVKAVPSNFIPLATKELFYGLLDALMETKQGENVDVMQTESIRNRIATMACKAAIKGNRTYSYKEAKDLIEEMLGCDEPYHCPHGRPTTISFSKYDLDKKFKRIV